MKSIPSVLLFLALATWHSRADTITESLTDGVSEAATPLGKVRQLLANLQKQVKDEGEAESQAYAEYTRWCDLEIQQCQNDISAAEQDMREQEAAADQARALQQTLTFEIEKLLYMIHGKETELDKAIQQRQKEHETFKVAQAELAKTIAVLGKVLDILSRPAPQGALMELSRVMTELIQQPQAPAITTDKLQNFFQQVDSGGGASAAPAPQQGSLLEVQQPNQPVYQSQMGNINKVVSDMKEDVEKNRKRLQDEELQQAHSFEKFKLACENEINAMKEALDNKQKAKQAAMEEEARAMQALADATALRDRTQQHKEDTTAGCQEKAREFESREKSRADELVAIGEAIKLLSKDNVGGAEKRREGGALLAQPASQPTAFLQVGLHRHGPAMQKVAALRAALGGSSPQVLSFLQQRLQQRSLADPFGKVKEMMEAMIKKLLTEAADEAEHKEWCDGEIAKTTKQLKKHTADEEKFKSRIEEYSAEIETTVQKIQESEGSLADMIANANEATKIRQKEHDHAVHAMKDYADAQAAVQQAITVLSNFYDKQRRENEALLQQGVSSMQQGLEDPKMGTGNAAPETFSGTNPGAERTGAAGSVLDIMEIALSDFARLHSEVQTEEETAKREFDQYIQSYNVQKATLQTEIKHLNDAEAQLHGSLIQAKGDLENTQKELKAVREYEEELNESCNFSGPNYEERQKRRQNQIQGLQNALAIMSGNAVA